MAQDDNQERERFRTEFGAALDAQLRKRSLRQTDLARQLGVSRQAINRTLSSESYSVTPSTVNRIGAAIGANAQEIQTLHYAAAKDRGYVLPDLMIENKDTPDTPSVSSEVLSPQPLLARKPARRGHRGNKSK